MYRPGAIGALLDIYKQAIDELKQVIADIPDDALNLIIDHQTQDENCKSIQAILSHVVSSSHGYATSIYNLKGHNIKRQQNIFRLTIKEYLQDLDIAFTFTEKVFNGIQDPELRQLDNSLKIKTGWGQLYDIEQMMEHAIVHILRHKKQIEKIKGDELNKAK